jgi:SAM-dependent methyltransferase
MPFSVPDQSVVSDRPGPIIEWEETPCHLCAARDWSPLVEAPDQSPGSLGLWFVVVQCQRCGLCFTNPRPGPTSIGQFYQPDYKPYRFRAKIGRGGRQTRTSHGRVRYGSQLLELPRQGERRLLDFGCGAGAFLERMHHCGWNVIGLDFSASAVHQIQSKLGLPVLLGSLPHPELTPNSFEVITMWQSLEHVHQPLEVLRQARELLVPGGRLLVTTPNIDSQAFRWFGPAWYGLDLPRHLTHFSLVTLPVMLERAGFQMRGVKMVRHSSWLRASARLTSRFPFRPHWRRWLNNKTVSRLAAWYEYLTRQSDCIMAMAEKSLHG